VARKKRGEKQVTTEKGKGVCSDSSLQKTERVGSTGKAAKIKIQKEKEGGKYTTKAGTSKKPALNFVREE